MRDRLVVVEPLTADVFAEFGDVLEATGDPDQIINEGFCGRWHDRALLDFANGCAGISLFKAIIRTLPFELELLERHPDGSQAFLPMTENPFLVVVAPDAHGRPGKPRAFITSPGQGINYHRGTWHGVLTPLIEPGLFAVVDRIGHGANLAIHRFDRPLYIDLNDNDRSMGPG